MKTNVFLPIVEDSDVAPTNIPLGTVFTGSISGTSSTFIKTASLVVDLADGNGFYNDRNMVRNYRPFKTVRVTGEY